jgi:hypothetical protein
VSAYHSADGLRPVRMVFAWEVPVPPQHDWNKHAHAGWPRRIHAGLCRCHNAFARRAALRTGGTHFLRGLHGLALPAVPTRGVPSRTTSGNVPAAAPVWGHPRRREETRRPPRAQSEAGTRRERVRRSRTHGYQRRRRPRPGSAAPHASGSSAAMAVCSWARGGLLVTPAATGELGCACHARGHPRLVFRHVWDFTLCRASYAARRTAPRRRTRSCNCGDQRALAR